MAVNRPQCDGYPSLLVVVAHGDRREPDGRPRWLTLRGGEVRKVGALRLGTSASALRSLRSLRELRSS